jgi:hypothetical protein
MPSDCLLNPADSSGHARNWVSDKGSIHVSPNCGIAARANKALGSFLDCLEICWQGDEIGSGRFAFAQQFGHARHAVVFEKYSIRCAEWIDTLAAQFGVLLPAGVGTAGSAFLPRL